MPPATAQRPAREPVLHSLAWSHTINARTFDVPLTVRVSHEELMPDVLACLPPGWVAGTRESTAHRFSVALGQPPQAGRLPLVRVYRDNERIARSTDRREAMLALESALRFAVAETSARSVFVHAGVVGWRGRAIVIPGVSGSGKTTLVKALVQAGAVYYSDEYAVLDDQGLVAPFPKPLSVRTGTSPWRARVSVNVYDGAVGDVPIPVGLVVVTRHRPGARWCPRPLSAGETALALVANTLRIRQDPAAVLTRLARALPPDASGIDSDRDDADSTAAAILAASNHWS